MEQPGTQKGIIRQNFRLGMKKADLYDIKEREGEEYDDANARDDSENHCAAAGSQTRLEDALYLILMQQRLRNGNCI